VYNTFDNNVYDHGHKAAVDEMRTSWETLVQYVGATYGQDSSNDLQNTTTVSRQTARERMIGKGQANL
jgi:hypothetical protein